MSTTTQKPYQYFAFISYNRADEKWAKWLQKKLESFSLPIAFFKENPKLPKKIHPVFRDQSELSGGILKKEIEKALDNSRFLIIVCSPHAAKSTWVAKEVQFFIDRGWEDRIIPFIIEGVPNSKAEEDECFPEGLRELSEDKEVLGVNINEMGREAAAFKVIAYILGLRFDRLWQRYNKQKKKRNAVIASVIIALFIAFMILFIIIWRKNRAIDTQNIQLVALVDKLREENKTFSQFRNHEEYYSYIGSLRGKESDNEFVSIAYHPNKPVIAFIDDWGVWLHNIKTNEESLVLTNNDNFSLSFVESMGFTDNGSYLKVVSYGDYCIIDIQTKQVKIIPGKGNEDNNTSDLAVSGGIGLYDLTLDSLNKIMGSDIEIKDDNLRINKGNMLITTSLGSPENGGCKILYNQPYNEVLFVGENRISIYSGDKHEFVQFFKGYDEYDIDMSSKGDYLRLGKDLFIRNIRPDTLFVNEFNTHSISEYDYKDINDRQINVTSDDYGYGISYYFRNKLHKIEVVKQFTMGTAQETISNVIFAHPNELIVIMECGKHRIYNADTGNLIGVLDNYADNTHLFGMNVAAKVIDRDLYVISADGTFSIYDLDTQKITKAVVFPVLKCDASEIIDKCYISNDGKTICYAFENDTVFYEFKLP